MAQKTDRKKQREDAGGRSYTIGFEGGEVEIGSGVDQGEKKNH